MKKFNHDTIVGLFVLAGLACVLYLTINLGNVELFQKGEQATYKARFFSIQGVKEGGRVNLAGVQVGQVTNIRLDEEDYSAIVEIRIKKGIMLYDDAILSVKTSGLIGDKYLELSPGGSGIELEAGEMIVDTESAVDLESLIGKVAFGGVEEE